VEVFFDKPTNYNDDAFMKISSKYRNHQLLISEGLFLKKDDSVKEYKQVYSDYERAIFEDKDKKLLLITRGGENTLGDIQIAGDVLYFDDDKQITNDLFDELIQNQYSTAFLEGVWIRQPILLTEYSKFNKSYLNQIQPIYDNPQTAIINNRTIRTLSQSVVNNAKKIDSSILYTPIYHNGNSFVLKVTKIINQKAYIEFWLGEKINNQLVIYSPNGIKQVYDFERTLDSNEETLDVSTPVKNKFFREKTKEKN
jgi:hypothetical protein